MVDTLTPAERSERMSRIRSSDTSPELSIRKALHRLGLRYTLANRDLPGKPDIVFRRKRIAVFVHGCFWHRHENCRVANMPKSNTAFWQEKFDRNVARDQRARAQLQKLGWRVEILWECELGPTNVARIANLLALIVRANEPQ
ncbi:very short patch repair endonuclease [Mesorhizobium kowhaii]|uniref:very short patch repair endonuclease n=1 Tax=Mesorhizobium kowhaii TaxID=1300272 RepID=UPI0035E662C6